MITEPKKRDVALVVDDSPETLRLLTDALDGAGMTVMVALDGAAAMRIVDQITPDIILLDAIMPGMDGFETCRRLKRDAGLSNVPVIFMTGLTETEHIVRGLEAGGVDYVTKPIAIEEMLARIRVHLANARLTQSARAALDASGRFLLAVNRQGRIMWSTPQAQKLLADHLESDADELVLPEPLLQWLEQAQKGKRRHGAAARPFRTIGAPASLHGQCAARTSCCCGSPRTPPPMLPADFSSELGLDDPRGRSAVVAVQGQDQPRHRADPGLEPAHRRQAPRADLRQARRGEPHRRGGDRDQCDAEEYVRLKYSRCRPGQASVSERDPGPITTGRSC